MFRKTFSLHCCLFSMLVLCQSCAALPVKRPHLIEKTAEVSQPSEIKTYTYADALDLAEDSEGFYNFFLLPGISPEQAYAFEQKLATEWGTGYNVYTGAHPYTVMALIDADVPIETLEAYIEVLVAHRKAKNNTTKYSTFRVAIKYYVELYNSIRTPANVKKYGSRFPAVQADAEKALLGLLLMLEDDSANDEDYLIHNAWRTLDRVKFNIYDETETD